MNLVTFLLILAILGIIIGILNKGARVIGFFVAMMAIVLLIGTPGSPNSNFFANLFNGNQTAQTPAAQAPTTTQPYYIDPNTGTPVYSSPNNSNTAGSNTAGSNTAGSSNAGSAAQGSPGNLSSQPFDQPQTQTQTQAQAPQPVQPTTQPQVLPGNTSVVTSNRGSQTTSYPYTPSRRALW
jgi:hypothetical protein